MMIDGWRADLLKERMMISGDSTTGTSESDTINPPKMVGWICPVCGRGLSPYTTVCPCKNDQK